MAILPSFQNGIFHDGFEKSYLESSLGYLSILKDTGENPGIYPNYNLCVFFPKMAFWAGK